MILNSPIENARGQVFRITRRDQEGRARYYVERERVVPTAWGLGLTRRWEPVGSLIGYSDQEAAERYVFAREGGHSLGPCIMPRYVPVVALTQGGQVIPNNCSAAR